MLKTLSSATLVILSLGACAMARAQEATDVARDRYLDFSAYTYYDSGSQVYFNNADNGDAHLDTDPALGFGIEVSHAREHSWGWSGGLTYDLRRSVHNASSDFLFFIPIDNSWYGPLPSLSFLTVYGNIMYRVRRWYFPFGLNLAIPFVANAPGDPGSTTANPGLGTQGGAGFHVTPNFSVEALLRVITFSMTRNTGVTQYDLHAGYMASLHLNLKLDF